MSEWVSDRADSWDAIASKKCIQVSQICYNSLVIWTCFACLESMCRVKAHVWLKEELHWLQINLSNMCSDCLWLLRCQEYINLSSHLSHMYFFPSLSLLTTFLTSSLMKVLRSSSIRVDSIFAILFLFISGSNSRSSKYSGFSVDSLCFACSWHISFT